MVDESNKGIVVDIHRFSLHDGPGIRTSIFLKGCPLHCKWCHNPEAVSPKPQLSFNAEKCKDCFECVEVCPSGAHQIINGKHKVDFGKCTLHKECVDVCPNGVLWIIGDVMNVEEIMKVVLKDKDYYSNSGGGITITGGEPMAQFEFTKELLLTAKKNNIHTCIETCGYSSTDRYLELLSLVDLFLFDFKETDPLKHKDYTGVDNKLILKNLSALYENGAKIILRCPLIPGVNDSDEHLSGIVKLAEEYPNIEGIELMPYHNIGQDKAKKIGKENEFLQQENTTSEKKDEWLDKLHAFGCENVKLG